MPRCNDVNVGNNFTQVGSNVFVKVVESDVIGINAGYSKFYI